MRPLLGGIWNENINLHIVIPDSGAAAFQLGKADNGQVSDSLQAYTIDDICEMAGVHTPLLVKIDIEGGQAKLFDSNTQWVGRTHLITLELDDWLLPWQGTSRTFFPV